MQSTKVNTKEGIGIRRTIWLPTPLDEKAEQVRKQLGLGKSAFYRFAVVEMVKQFTTTQNKGEEPTCQAASSI
jgi:hypothetical protein